MRKIENLKESLGKYFFSTKYDDRTPFEKIIGYCDSCPYCSLVCLFKYPKTVRMNTMYADEKSNYFTGCDEILEYIDKSNSERWEEYYNSRF